MSNLELTGYRFGELTVIKRDGTSKNKHSTWVCRCDCGNTAIVPSDKLRSGRTKTCGHTRYGKKPGYHPARDNPRLYVLWLDMKGRCYCKTRDNYKYYGGKGIRICEEWLDFPSFCEWALSNGYNESANHGECTIDRIDISKGYEPGNCRFVSWDIQANNRSDNRYITYKGQTKTLSEWARVYDIKWATLKARLDSGWSMEKAVTTPVRKLKRRDAESSNTTQIVN